jgi:hypothetical protein
MGVPETFDEHFGSINFENLFYRFVRLTGHDNDVV